MNTPGFRFKEGKLFLFDQKSLSVIEAWPSLKALRKEGSFGWQEFRPIFPLLSPMGAEPEIDPALLPRESFQMAYQRRAAFRAFRSFIPEALAKACEEIPGRQMTMLMLLQASPAAAELAEGNRALAFALLASRVFSGALFHLAGSGNRSQAAAERDCGLVGISRDGFCSEDAFEVSGCVDFQTFFAGAALCLGIPRGKENPLALATH